MLIVFQISQAVQFLHDLGSVQHFQNNVLKTHVVIDPQWIVDAMACVVSVNDSPIEVSELSQSTLLNDGCFSEWQVLPQGHRESMEDFLQRHASLAAATDRGV